MGEEAHELATEREGDGVGRGVEQLSKTRQ